MNKKIAIDSIGIRIKEAREKLNLTQEELAWKINDNKIDYKRIRNWENGKEFPNLDEIYKLAYIINVNPNELLDLKNKIQEESKTEPNWFIRHIFSKIMSIGKPGFKIIFEVILGICIIYLALSYKKFERKMSDPNDPEQMEFVEKVMQNQIEEYVYNNEISNENLTNT